MISFSKRRYNASVEATAPPGTSIITVHANTGNSKRSLRYYIISVNGKRVRAKTRTRFDMDPEIGNVEILFDFLAQPMTLAYHDNRTNVMKGRGPKLQFYSFSFTFCFAIGTFCF